MKKLKFYFTNPTDGRHVAKEVERKILASLNIKLENPFYDEYGVPTPEIAELDKGKRTSVSDNEIVDCDLEKIDKTDGLIAWITKDTSWGSVQECFYSSRVVRKPTYIIFHEPDLSKTKLMNNKHPWARRNSTRVFVGVDNFIAFGKKEWGGK